MEEYEKNIVPHIEAIYDNFTTLEKNIADFFIHNEDKSDLSSKNVSQKLYVSEATLSRFAKKCGFKGYREFVFSYQQSDMAAKHPRPASNQIKTVLNSYQELLNKSYALMNEEQIERIVKIISEKKRIYVYGKGSSGLVAKEMRLRFMRIGVNIEAIVDEDVMKMNAVLLNEECAVIGISISGRTEVVINSVKVAKECSATTILMTAHVEKRFGDFCDEVLLFAVKENLDTGKAISPQFPILVMVDIIYSRMLLSDHFRRETLHEFTLEALDRRKR